jgi:hypothetical protein
MKICITVYKKKDFFVWNRNWFESNSKEIERTIQDISTKDDKLLSACRRSSSRHHRHTRSKPQVKYSHYNTQAMIFKHSKSNHRNKNFSLFCQIKHFNWVNMGPSSGTVGFKMLPEIIFVKYGLKFYFFFR